MKENICTVIGVFGGFIAALLGGWDSAMITLVIFMGIDFTTGLITATMGRSKHSKTGKLSSKAGWVGLAKKFCILLMVVVAVRMDILIGTTYIRDATCIGFCVNELLSIIENSSLMGIPYPPAIRKAIEVLQKRAQHIDDDIQEIGFTGIANITAAYQYTHVDVRPNGKWYGDEVHGNSTVTDDFYKYFGGEDMKGIDVSVHNGDIDWGKVKADGIDFAILRAGFGRLASQKDERFEQNYSCAKAAGIPIGAYWYSYAMSEDEARLEADVFLSIIKEKQFDLGKGKVSAIMRAFLERVEAAGYFVGLYGSASSLTTHTADDIKNRYTIWLAHWVNQTSYGGAYDIWQHSEKGKVDGINGNVDLDICYKDFPTIIKGKGLNGWDKAEPTSTPAPDKPDTTVTATIKIGTDTYKGTLVKE